MAFMDSDPLEEDMAVRVEDMNADQLVTYLRDYQKALNGLTIASAGAPEYKRMLWLIAVYGQPDAGRIIKWTYWKHRGRWKDRKGTEVIRPMRFNAKMKWWVDILHTEMQQQVQRERNAVPAKTSAAVAGFATASDL